MRIRIIRPPEGVIDGIPLDHFERGELYDVSVSIGTYLMVSGYAQAVAETIPAKIVPLDFTSDTRARVKELADDSGRIGPRNKGPSRD